MENLLHVGGQSLSNLGVICISGTLHWETLQAFPISRKFFLLSYRTTLMLHVWRTGGIKRLLDIDIPLI